MICTKRQTVPSNRTLATPAPDLAPTAERQKHGPVESVSRPIADQSGGLARPFRAVDTLMAMERRGSITPGMRQAAEDFRSRFAVAQLDPLHAFDYSRPRDRARGRNPADHAAFRAENAREHVWRAIVALGGLRSPGGSCVWHVVGWERSIKEWALEQGWNGKRVSQEAASGILIAALGALEAHYQGGISLPKSHPRLTNPDRNGSNAEAGETRATR